MSKKCYIMGLPEAGKTTFLAALWHSINNNSIETKLKLNRIMDGQYLTSLSRKWVDAIALERTLSHNEQKDICINLKTSENETFDLFFPDLSGETFQNQYEDREISEDLVQYITTSDSILFFINVDKVKQVGFISEHSGSLSNSSTTQILREPKNHDPLQIQVIELLQFIFNFRKNEKINVNFMLSAWDLVKCNENELRPEQFISKYMNMLWQFCSSNSDALKCDFWGISAQGGKLEDRKILLEKDFPIERIIVEDNMGNKSNDITLPLYNVLTGV